MLDSDIRPEVGEALTVGRQDVVSRGRLQRGRGSLLPGGQWTGSGSGNGRHDESTGIRDLAPCQRSVRLCGGPLVLAGALVCGRWNAITLKEIVSLKPTLNQYRHNVKLQVKLRMMGNVRLF